MQKLGYELVSAGGKLHPPKRLPIGDEQNDRGNATNSEHHVKGRFAEIHSELSAAAARHHEPAWTKSWTDLRRPAMRDALGVRTANQRRVPPTARSFVFVCFGKSCAAPWQNS